MSQQAATLDMSSGSPTIDPVCGMTIDPAHAAADFTYEGVRYFFCAKSCQQEFAADPKRYLRKPVEKPAASAVKDPVCGMKIDPDTAAATEVYRGQTVHFCSTHCRQKFIAEPTRYVDGLAPAVPQPSSTQAAEYTCPMHPEVRQPGPGSCPKCGMDLEPTRPAATKRKVIYTCPMHPQIEKDEPGACPICGMDLEPKTVEPGVEEDDTELRSMTRRFWVGVVLTIPVLSMAMLPMLGVPVDHWLGATVHSWLQLVLSTPVVLWCGWPFFERGWSSIVTWNLNMFTRSEERRVGKEC